MVCSLAGGTWLPVINIAMMVLWMSMAVGTISLLNLNLEATREGKGGGGQLSEISYLMP